MSKQKTLTDGQFKKVQAQMNASSGMLESHNRELSKATRTLFNTFDNEKLLNIAANNTSTWSGGASVRNMVEQIEREVALDILQKR